VELFSLSIENPFPHLNDAADFLKKSNILLNANLLTYFRSILLSHMCLKWKEAETEVMNQLFFVLNSQGWFSFFAHDLKGFYGNRLS